ncbi:NADPH dehydrogenase [Corynebacterium occultum]|uniref:NADPH dehydrogenase n=1 Tax=Corynebacterium occultum TaxID=2675219 RepID=A0A6B8WFD8_9CORY|nr:NADH:flavin oxidoreductase/NADH oxidase [Corynebacterium occultum]QGU08690.1 NADPH dehydrogenase [Corynebacterium occultum]
MNVLFEKMQLRDLEIANRIWLPPMCQYRVQERDGVPTDWHLVHYGARAVGGFGLIIAESTGIVPEGRISPNCTGLWNEEQVQAWRRIVDFVHAQGAKMGVQLNHAGRKSSTVPLLPDQPTYDGTETIPLSEGGWEPVGPSAVANDGLAVPREMTLAEIRQLPEDFVAATHRAMDAGFDTVELHAAHGYLLHQFLSPLANKREDEYGGSFENRTRLLREVVVAVRKALPEGVPLLLRLSATDWRDDVPSWTVEESVKLAGILKELGVDLMDVSTGGLVKAQIPVGPGYQVSFAEQIQLETGMPTAAVGLITEPQQALDIIQEVRASAVLIGREALRDPSFPWRIARETGVDSREVPFPVAYHRAAWR